MTKQSNEYLINRVKALHWHIFVHDVRGEHDISEYEALIKELENRGYECVETIDFVRRTRPAD